MKGSAFSLIKQTFSDWSEDKAPRLGAALAFYAIFSIPPLILLIVATVGFFYKGDVTGAIQQQLSGIVGEETAKTMMEVRQQQSGEGGFLAGALGIGLLLLGASGVFGQLQDAMNTIWEVKPKENRGILGMIKDRFLSFTMVLGVAFLLLVSLILSAGIAAVSEWLPGGSAVGHVIELSLSFVVITLLFAMIFKFLPDVKIGWNDVWIGAAGTAALFVIGKFLIGLYLSKASISSSYGAAGPVIIMILWIYYSAQILFLGAEFTQVYANQYGSRVTAGEHAEQVSEEDRAQEGLTESKGDAAPASPRSAPSEDMAPAAAPTRPSFLASVLVGYFVGRRKATSEKLRGEDKRDAA
jgi:membrane protein